MSTAKEIVESVLTPATTKKLWTSVYWPALPFTPQDFNMGAVLTAAFYMFRWGKRRGQGKFASTFGVKTDDGVEKPTIESVVSKLVQTNDSIQGFKGKTGHAVLGDMLLTSCLENKKHLPGRNHQIQRVYPIHYLSSWIDLPETVAHLRYIPELLVSILSGHSETAKTELRKNRSLFPLGESLQNNLLLRLYAQGTKTRGSLKSDMKSDVFDELDDSAFNTGIDQLLLIRVAQACGEAPAKARGGGETEDIPNQEPLAIKATQCFREDINVLIQAYGSSVPRKAFSIMLESCFSLGFTNIYMSTFQMLLNWEKNGKLSDLADQKPWPFFMDCSLGNDNDLRLIAEESMGNMLRTYERFPVILMLLRILDEKARFDRALRKNLPPDSPDATNFINYLGDILFESSPSARRILDDLEEKCLKLADELEQADESLPVVDLLRQLEPNSASRLAEAMVYLLGTDLRRKHFLTTLDALSMVNTPHGLCKKRATLRKNSQGKQSRADVRSVVLTNSMLDFMVHRYLRKAAKGKGPTRLSLVDFIKILKQKYGLYINESPQDMSVSSESLNRNKQILERRLRDLGLLVGVNDAESMKRLRQRFKIYGDEDE